MPETAAGATRRRLLFVNADLCTGCRLCELACADAHDGIAGGGRSRIHVESWPEANAFVPVVCMHCTRPPCVEACPSLARSRCPETGAILIDTQACTGCGECRRVCPFDVPRLHPQEGFCMGCDLCSGEPACTEACTVGALAYIHPSGGARKRERNWAERNVRA
jgi:Fe-S-cluster-containing dehydrogenase component